MNKPNNTLSSREDYHNAYLDELTNQTDAIIASVQEKANTHLQNVRKKLNDEVTASYTESQMKVMANFEEMRNDIREVWSDYPDIMNKKLKSIDEQEASFLGISQEALQNVRKKLQ